MKDVELTTEMVDELGLPTPPKDFEPDVLYRGHTWEKDSVGYYLFSRIGYYVSIPVPKPDDHFIKHINFNKIVEIEVKDKKGRNIGPVSKVWEESKEAMKRRRIAHLLNKWWDLRDLKWVYKMECTIKGKTIFNK